MTFDKSQFEGDYRQLVIVGFLKINRHIKNVFSVRCVDIWRTACSITVSFSLVAFSRRVREDARRGFQSSEMARVALISM